MKFPIINQYYTVPQWLSDEAKDLAAYAIAQFMLKNVYERNFFFDLLVESIKNSYLCTQIRYII